MSGKLQHTKMLSLPKAMVVSFPNEKSFDGLSQ